MDEPRNEGPEPVDVEEQNAELLPDREAMSVIGDPTRWTLPPLEATDPGVGTLPVEPPASA